MWPGPRPTSIPSGIPNPSNRLATIQQRYRRDRQTHSTDNDTITGRTGLQTVAQKLKPGLVASYDIGLETEMALFVTYLLRHLATYLQPRDPHGARGNGEM